MATFLVDLCANQLYLTNTQAIEIVRLWNNLVDFDKRPIVFQEVFTKETKGRFRAKKQAAIGIESTESQRYVFIWAYFIQQSNLLKKESSTSVIQGRWFDPWASRNFFETFDLGH